MRKPTSKTIESQRIGCPKGWQRVLTAFIMAGSIVVAGCQSSLFRGGNPCGPSFAWPVIPIDWPWQKKAPPPPDVEYLQACQQLSYFVSPRYWENRPRRVLLMCPEANQIPAPLQQKTLENVAAQLRQERLFEVIVMPTSYTCSCNWDAIRKGRFDELQLLEKTQQYECDAVMILAIHQFEANWPMNVAVTAALIDREEAVVLMAGDGQWDMGDHQRQRIYESYLKRFAAIEPQWLSINRQSPQQMQKYIGWQFAQVLANPELKK